MTATIARRIVEQLVSRAKTIRKKAGYNTDAGLHVFVSRPTVDAADLDAVVISPGKAIGTPRQGRRVQWMRTIVIDALGLADPENPGLVAEDLLGDLQKAIFDVSEFPGRSPVLGGLAVKMEPTQIDTEPRDEGGSVAGATLELSVDYVTDYGDPYT